MNQAKINVIQTDTLNNVRIYELVLGLTLGARKTQMCFSYVKYEKSQVSWKRHTTLFRCCMVK